ncbi:hypothetical protein Peur_022452 [Populus x canadensis]
MEARRWRTGGQNGQLIKGSKASASQSIAIELKNISRLFLRHYHDGARRPRLACLNGEKDYSGTMDNEKGESSGGDNAGANDGRRKKLSRDGAEALKECLEENRGP